MLPRRLPISIDLRAIAIVFLLIAIVALFGGCSLFNTFPDSDTFERAIALQSRLTHEPLRQALQAEPLPQDIRQVSVRSHQKLKIRGLQAFRFRGTYERIVELAPGRTISRQQPFDLYLQRQKEGKTWRLFVRDRNRWRGYLVPWQH